MSEGQGSGQVKPSVHVVKALMDAAKAEGIGFTLAVAIRLVRAVEEGYALVPVGQRMEAMGMTRSGWANNPGPDGTLVYLWREADHG